MLDTDKQALIDGSATIEYKISFDDTELNEYNIVNTTYEDYRYVDSDSLVIGQFVARMLKGEIDTVDKDLLIEDKDINVKMGINSDTEVAEITIDGNSYQETTNGYQLFDESKLPSEIQNGTTLINNNDGSFTMEGNDTLSGNFNHYYNYSHEETLKLLKAGDITISDNGVVGQTTVPYYLAQLRNSNGQIFEISSRVTNSYEKTITQEMLDDEATFLRIGFFGLKGTSLTKKTIKPMLFQDGNGTFENFTEGKPSPNLDYPQEIETIENNIMLYQTNKNICPTNFNDWESGQYNPSGNKTDYPTRIRLKELLRVKPNTEYYFVTNDNLDYKQMVFAIRAYDKNKNITKSIGIIGNANTMTTGSNDYYLGVSILYQDDTTYEDYKEMFENGILKPFICLNIENDKSFVEHKEREYIINLNDNSLGKIGNLKDELLINDSGNISLEKIIKKITLKSSDVKNLTAKYTNTIRFDMSVLTDSAIVSRNKIMCNSLPVAYEDASDTEHIRNSSSQYSTSLCLYINKNRLEDTSSDTAIVNSFKKYLDEHEIIVCYELDKADTLKLDDEVQINLFPNDSNYFTLESNLETTFSSTPKTRPTKWYSLGNFLVTKPSDDDVKDKLSFESMDYTKKNLISNLILILLCSHALH